MPVELDITTLSLVLALVTLCLSLLLTLAALHAEQQRGLRHWALGHSALTIGLLLGVNAQTLPSMLSVVIASGLMVLGVGVIWLGLRDFRQQSQSQLPVLLTALLCMLLQWLLLDIYQTPAATYPISSTALCLFTLLSARELLRPWPQPLRSACWLAGGLFLLASAGLVLRALATLSDNGEQLLPGHGPHAASLLGLLLLQIGLACCFMLMTLYQTALSLARLSERDGLTGILNRRSLCRQGSNLLQRCQRQQQPACLLMLDADHFKRINDEFGHQTGDAVLCHMSSRIGNQLRQGDLFGRFGGEEFTLLLPGLQPDEAMRTAERIRLALCNQPCSSAGQLVQLSASIGMAHSNDLGYDFEKLLGAADHALYRAKHLGRNRVEATSPPGNEVDDLTAMHLLTQFRHNLDI